MAQTYKMMLGTSGKQWEELTIKEDGTMMMTFHGTDRSVTQQVTAVTEGEWNGWLRSEKGSMWPGIDSGRWQLMEAADITEVQVQSPCAERFAREDISQPSPNPKRQRKPRKPVVEHQPSAISHQPSKSNDHAWLQSAGYLAAASVALAILWQTGLIIPLGLIGLATSGFLK